MGSQTLSFSDAIIKTTVALAPAFVTLCILFVVFAWLRYVVDSMSPRGM